MTGVIEQERHVEVGADPSFDEVYQRLRLPMLRLATGLVDQIDVAEDVVQDAFMALYRNWDGLRTPAAVAGYVRTSVVNGSRSTLRRRGTARRHLMVVREGSEPAADESTILSAEQQLAREALATLPQRQREVLALRYMAEVSDAEISAATGLSLSGVRSAASRGLAAMRASLEAAL